MLYFTERPRILNYIIGCVYHTNCNTIQYAMYIIYIVHIVCILGILHYIYTFGILGTLLLPLVYQKVHRSQLAVVSI